MSKPKIAIIVSSTRPTRFADIPTAKPFGAIAHGSMGGANALGRLQNIGVELQMVPTRSNVRIGGSDFFRVHPAWAVQASWPISRA